MQMRDERGFTLVELLVVFAIAALLMAIVPIAIDKLQESMQYRQTVRTVLMDLRAARFRAITEGREVLFTVDLGQGTFGVNGQPKRDLPKSLQLRATVASIELADADTASIRFLPAGGATGGALDILRPTGSGVRVSIDWLSGRASQTPLTP